MSEGCIARMMIIISFFVMEESGDISIDGGGWLHVYV